MSDSDRDHLKTTFNQDAEHYDRARPGYPEPLFDDLVALARLQPGARLLEVGCGTGRATVPLARRGIAITCVELGENLAAVARRNLSGFPEVRVVVAPFETWDAGGETFDLVYAASSWHWLDPDIRYARAAGLLKPGGSLAIISGGHAFPKDADPFFRDIQQVYEAIGEDKVVEWPLPADVPDMREEIEVTGLFGDFQSRRYVWELVYTAKEYIDLLNTFSGHIALDPEKRDYLYRNVRDRINARSDPRVRRHWLAILNVARRV
ncbi:MAG: class I SAM-dependent methyltransferase [Chloroflexi bacterium]|nr:MAG: class I SAM-dependent methyltransferase [Chloroflexota bacterium]